MASSQVLRPHIAPDADGTFDSRYYPHVTVDAMVAGAGAVTSVNAKTGAVSLTQDDVLDGVTAKQYPAADQTKLAGIQAGAQVNAVTSVAARTGAVVLVKGDVGLGSVDNTTDLAKPVSTAQQTALNLKAPLASPTFTGVPAAPTPANGTNTTQLATTAFVAAGFSALGHTHALNPALSNHAARSGGTVGTFNSQLAVGTNIASASGTLAGLTASVTYDVFVVVFAMIQSAATTTWAAIAANANSTVGDFVGHKLATMSGLTAAYRTTVTGVTAINFGLNARNDISGTCSIGDAMSIIRAVPQVTA